MEKPLALSVNKVDWPIRREEKNCGRKKTTSKIVE